jgi:ribose/xylose/arabinose/galactoside ABC-type transport system permease subunit
MRAIIITIGACILVGGIALAVQHALPMQQNIYSSVPEAGVLWYALGGPTPDRLRWLGADGLLGSFLEQPLDLVLVIVGTCIALIGLTQRARH